MMKKLDFNEKGVIVLNYDQKLDEMSDDDRIAIEGMNPSDHQVCAKSKLLDSSVRARATPTTISPAQAQLRNEADKLKIKLDAMGTEQRPIVGARRKSAIDYIRSMGQKLPTPRSSDVSDMDKARSSGFQEEHGANSQIHADLERQENSEDLPS